MSATSLIARLQAAGLALQGLEGNPLTSAQNEQYAATLACLKEHSYEGGDASNIVQAISQVGLQPDQTHSLINLLWHRRPRAKMQNYEAAVNYHTENQWSSLLSAEVDQHTKSDILVDRVLRLFGRNLSEDTFAVLTAFLALCLEGVEKGAHTAPPTLRALFLGLKRSFARYKKMEASVRMEVLPTSPQTFRTLVGEAAYGAVYTEAAPPVPCKLPWGLLTDLANKVVRRDRGGTSNALSNALQPTQMQLGGGGGHVQSAMVEAMMGFMQQMQMQLGSGGGHVHGGIPGLTIYGGNGQPDTNAGAPWTRRPSLRVLPPLAPSAVCGESCGPPFQAGAEDADGGESGAGVGTGALNGGDGRAADPPAAAGEVTAPVTPIAMASLTPSKHPAAATATHATKSPGEAIETALAAMGTKQQAARKDNGKRKGKKKGGAAEKSKAKKPKDPKPPSYSHEQTRSQFLFRTGLSGDGQSTAIKYTAATKAGAKAKAVAMVAKEKKKRRLL